MDRKKGRYAYVNPSVDQSGEVHCALDHGVLCRVENLRGLLHPLVGAAFNGDDRKDTMKTNRSSAASQREEGVHFLLGDEEDGNPVSVRSWSRSSRQDSVPTPTSPPPYIADFDQLFQGYDSRYPLPPGYNDANQDLYLDESPDSPVERQLVRQNSSHCRMCKSSFKELVRGSWQNTTHFLAFQRRLGAFLNDKYCMRIKMESTVFMFLHVVYGAALLVMATFAWNRERGVDSILGAYLTVNGVLSVFLFPIMFLEWSTRVGGCLEEGSHPTKGYYFFSALILRISLCIAGAACVYLRHPVYIGPEAVQDFADHDYQFQLFMISVYIDWGMFFLSIIAPCGCCWCVYMLAGTMCCRPSASVAAFDKQWITEKT